MRVAISLSATGGPWGDFVTYAQEAERLGAAICFVAEAWGTDAVSPLAYLAAKTERILLASGIMQISARTPVTTAQTALTLATLSGNRFILGLGVSGPAGGRGLTWRALRPPLRTDARNAAHHPLGLCRRAHCLSGQALRATASGWRGQGLAPQSTPKPHPA